MWYTILLTSTRSLISSVFSIDPDGIQKAWIAKVLITTASSSATATRIGSSRQNDRCLRLRRWPRRGPPGPSSGVSPGAAAVASAASSVSACAFPVWVFSACALSACVFPACGFGVVWSAAAWESAADLTADPESRASDAALSCGPLT